MNIMLACSGGFSTSMLIGKIKEAAQKRGLEITVDAMPETNLEDVIDQLDVVLLGPQVRYKEDSLKRKFSNKPVAIATIPSIDFGRLNGEKVLDLACKLIEK